MSTIQSSSVDIGFYGGEPLLELELIRQVVEYSEKLFAGKKLTFSMTTNGTLLTEEMIPYLKEHGIKLMISLDGPKEINDQNRVFQGGRGTFDAVMGKLKMVRRVDSEYAHELQISMVMNPENDFDCINEVYIKEEQLEELFVSAAIVDMEYDDKQAGSSEEYTWKYQYQRFLALLSYMGRIDKKKISPIMVAPVIADMERRLETAQGSRLYAVDAPSGPCIPGQLRLFCTADGTLLPCERVSETSKTCYIGSLEKGLDLERVSEFLNVSRITAEDCKQCWSFRYCTLCGKKADGGNGRLEAERKRKFCSEVHSYAASKMMLSLLFQEIPVYYGKQAAVIEGGEG